MTNKPQNRVHAMPGYWRSNYFRTYVIVVVFYEAASIMAFIPLIMICVILALVKIDYYPFFNFFGIILSANIVLGMPGFPILYLLLNYIGYRIRSSRAVQKMEQSKAEVDSDVWTLIVQLQGSNANSRISAVRGLRIHNTRIVEETLAKTMLDDPDTNVRFEAYLALKFMGKQKIGPLLERLKAEPGKEVKLALLDMLRKTGDKDQIGTLIFLYSVESDKGVKLSILESLCKFDRYDIKDLAISILRKEDDKDIRLKALDVLGWYGDKATCDVLRYLRNDDSDIDIRHEAEKVLASVESRRSS